MNELAKKVAEYLRVEDDDTTLEPLVSAAKQYIRQSTGIHFDGQNEVYETAIKMLAAHWYENRGVLSANAMEIPFSVESLINHIKLCGDYRE